MTELEENKALMRSWLFRLLAELENAKEVDGSVVESGHTTTITVTMKS